MHKPISVKTSKLTKTANLRASVSQLHKSHDHQNERFEGPVQTASILFLEPTLAIPKNSVRSYTYSTECWFQNQYKFTKTPDFI